MYCWKNWLAISGGDPAKLLTKSNATTRQLLFCSLMGILTTETEIGDISHSVLDGPKNGVIDKLELRWG